MNSPLDSELNGTSFSTIIHHSAAEENPRKIPPVSSGDTKLIKITLPSPIKGEMHPMNDTVIMILSNS